MTKHNNLLPRQQGGRKARRKMHKGKPIIMPTENGVMLLCPVGHYIDFVERVNWAGSYAEAQWHKIKEVECDGTLPTDKQKGKAKR